MFYQFKMGAPEEFFLRFLNVMFNNFLIYTKYKSPLIREQRAFFSTSCNMAFLPNLNLLNPNINVGKLKFGF